MWQCSEKTGDTNTTEFVKLPEHFNFASLIKTKTFIFISDFHNFIVKKGLSMFHFLKLNCTLKSKILL